MLSGSSGFHHFFSAEMSVLVQTTLGDFTIDLNLKRAPQSSLNFIKLCKSKHFHFSQVNRVQAGLCAGSIP